MVGQNPVDSGEGTLGLKYPSLNEEKPTLHCITLPKVIASETRDFVLIPHTLATTVLLETSPVEWTCGVGRPAERYRTNGMRPMALDSNSPSTFSSATLQRTKVLCLQGL